MFVRLSPAEDTTIRKSRFSEEQIIAILEEAEAGVSPGELCSRHGISGATLYNWRKKYGGMDVSDDKCLKTLEDENAKLKMLLSDQMKDVATLKELRAKNF